MDFEKDDKVDILIEKGEENYSLISHGEIISVEDRFLEIKVYKAKNLLIGSQYYMLSKKNEGVFAGKIEIKQKDIDTVTAAVDGSVTKIQRREYYRLREALLIKMKNKDISIMDISGGGIGYISNKEAMINQPVIGSVEIENREIKFEGVVVRNMKMDEEKILVGIRFTKIASKDQDFLLKYISTKQTNLLRKGRI